MELRQMRYFVAVAEELHFRRAAERLLISTPTLSQQIKAVEREVGGPLLIRRSTGVELTPAGEVLLREARVALAASDDAVRQARLAAGAEEAVFRFGLLNVVPPELTRRVERSVAARLPGSRMVMTSGTTSELMRLLESGRVDLAHLRAPVALPPTLRATPVAEEELGVVMSDRHPLVESDDLGIADLSAQELMLFARVSSPGLHDALLATMRGAGVDVRLSPSAMGHAQMLSVLALRPDVLSLSSDRVAGTPGLAWRRLRGRPIVVTYVAAWHVANGRSSLGLG